ncbi:hypothetical protein [Halomarina pelagica]|uniref:hypothetical protein n=1 Tax=Halomarina pelagica TaxID=2961599 RepID=UPI0020C5AE77|nr:hypothetical protein [Halomarina sp. BND7]
MSDADSFAVPVDAPRPSQLYLSSEKLVRALAWFDADEPSYDPLPAIRLEGVEGWVLIDGHTRAFLAALSGATELRLREDDDDHPRALYAECVGWCEAEGVTSVRDLFGRVVGPWTYEERWLARCRRAAERLEE